MTKKLIEAALFMSTKPLKTEEIAKITGTGSVGEVERMLNEIKREHRDRGFELTKTSEGWIMQVRSDLLPKVAHLTPYSDLSDGHKRTLALAVYKEPIKQSEVIRIQGNKAYNYVKFLQRKGLIKTEKYGRTKLIYLTGEFERYFGTEKEKIREMLTKAMDEMKDAQEAKPAAKPVKTNLSGGSKK